MAKRDIKEILTEQFHEKLKDALHNLKELHRFTSDAWAVGASGDKIPLTSEKVRRFNKGLIVVMREGRMQEWEAATGTDTVLGYHRDKYYRCERIGNIIIMHQLLDLPMIAASVCGDLMSKHRWYKGWERLNRIKEWK